MTPGLLIAYAVEAFWLISGIWSVHSFWKFNEKQRIPCRDGHFFLGCVLAFIVGGPWLVACYFLWPWLYLRQKGLDFINARRRKRTETPPDGGGDQLHTPDG